MEDQTVKNISGLLVPTEKNISQVMRIPFWTGLKYTSDEFLTIGLPTTTKCKNFCCNKWEEGICEEECDYSKRFWEPIRESLTQEGIKKHSIVTLDCYFSPPNLLDIGVVDAIRGKYLQILYFSGKVITVKRDQVFRFPDTCRVYQLKFHILLRHKKGRNQIFHWGLQDFSAFENFI